mgnify:CR=1 FL=1
MLQLTQEQVVQLAPDQASAKAGLQLAVPGKWLSKYKHEKALWGECQGSGSKPYLTQIDLGNIAFKCTCPSRKFPCKHGLGLLFLYINHGVGFTQTTDLPKELEQWIDKRAAVKPKEKEIDKPVDQAAQAKRKAARESKILNGMVELRLWLKDLSRAGIAQIPAQQYEFNKNIMARMVDAQANGLANRLRQLNTIPFFQTGWQIKLIRQLAGLYLLSEAYLHKEALPDELQQDILNMTGWTFSKDEIINATSPVPDNWLVLSKETEAEGPLTTEKIWLFGLKTNRFALLLQFYANNHAPELRISTATVVQGAAHFYPSAYPLRVILQPPYQVLNLQLPNPVNTQMELLLSHYAAAAARQPLLESFPVLLHNCSIVPSASGWHIRDPENKSLPLLNKTDDCWKILAVTKAAPFSGFALLNHEGILIQACWLDGTFIPTV